MIHVVVESSLSHHFVVRTFLLTVRCFFCLLYVSSREVTNPCKCLTIRICCTSRRKESVVLSQKVTGQRSDSICAIFVVIEQRINKVSAVMFRTLTCGPNLSCLVSKSKFVSKFQAGGFSLEHFFSLCLVLNIQIYNCVILSY